VIRILFICSTHACLSRMAEAFARAQRPQGVEVASAGVSAAPCDPLTARVLAEVGIDLADPGKRSLEDLWLHDYHILVTLSPDAAASCRHLAGHPAHVRWDLEDPSASDGDESELLAAFRTAREKVRKQVDGFFSQGYMTALAEAGTCHDIILDSVSDGIIAHDLNRRIFYFNREAENLTGYPRDEVVGRDCQDVFPGGLCGAKCPFAEGPNPQFDRSRTEIEIVTRTGERRTVSRSLRAIVTEGNHTLGVVGLFHDVTRERDLARRVGEIQQFSGIIGRDKKMLEVFDLIRDLADTMAPVLIQGESGTGKELVAAAIHNEGPRAGGLFVPVNCGALPETLLESELFGHVKGAFTGAVRDKKGRFELADGGTIFLDEIGDIPPPMQVKLLRVLQQGKFERLGSENTIQVNVRVISATNKDLAEEIAAGRFRDDLYYRLSVVPLWLPPLRERRNDIPLLAEHILNRILRAAGRSGVKISDDALDLMLNYDWPGNVRELENWIQFALVKCKGEQILPIHLPPSLTPSTAVPRSPQGHAPSNRALAGRRRKLDVRTVRAALAETQGNKLAAARVLGVSRATLYRFLEHSGPL